MSMRIRQFVWAAPDLKAAEAEIGDLLGAEVCYRDPGVGFFGLENALFAVGDQFVEIVAPTKDGTAAGRHMERHGPSGYMLILQTDDFARDRARLDELGVRTVWDAEHEDIVAVHIHPKDIGAAIVSIDQPVPPESWKWAGTDWQGAGERSASRAIRAVTVGAKDPEAMAARWAEVLGLERNGLTLPLDGGELRFVENETDVLAAVEIAKPDAEAETRPVLGVEVTLVPA